MQFKKLVAAGTLGVLMAGSSVAFAALSDFPEPFVTSSGVQSFVVVGAAAAPSDVVGAVDLAARLGGEVTTDVTISGASVGFNIDGEGREVATTNTKLYLDDSLGKSGVRTTMTREDLPTLLATEALEDTDASTTHNYQQFIYLTPSATGSALYTLQFDKPGSTSSVDPDYNIGRWPTSLTDAWMYRTYITFDKDVNTSTAAGERMTLFGRVYTVHTDTTANPGALDSTDKLVLSGGASESAILSGGETVEVSHGGTTYEVTYVASSDSTTGIVKVGSDQNTITQGQSRKVGGLDIFMERVFDISSTDPTLDSAKMQFGASKIVLTHTNKVKTGDSEDSVDGTYVNLTLSGGKLAAFQVAVGGKSSTEDFVKAGGGTYTDPVWKSFGLNFASVTPGLMDASRSVIKVNPSGDNNLEVTYNDDRGNEKTINWGYKALSTDTTFTLADSSGNEIVVVENVPVARDAYFTTTAGDFSHLFRVSGLSADATSSSNADILDIFSGNTLRLNLGTDDYEAKVIDGQTFHLSANSTHLNTTTWGTGAALNDVGSFLTVFPTVKGKNGEKLAFFEPVTINVTTFPTWDLPTGAVTFAYSTNGPDKRFNITAASKEDTTSSALAAAVTNVNASDTPSTLFTLGRTATGGLIYNITFADDVATLRVVGSTGGVGLTQPGMILVEEKDDASNQYSVVVSGNTETSGSNYLAVPSAPDFTATEDSSSLGSDSTLTDYVDLYGTYVRRTTTSQDTLTIYYPDEQVTANLFVLDKDATVTQTAGGTSSTVKSATPVKTALGKLDTEVTSADKNNKNLILVGGPAVNTLVAELATAEKTKARQWYVDQGAGTSLLNLVEDAFTTGKSALVVAGHSAADTRAATSMMQNYDAQTFSSDEVVLKNGVISTATA